MKLKITCPGCNEGFVLDESAAGEEFVCPSCMTRSRVGVPRVEPAAAKTPPPDSVVPESRPSAPAPVPEMVVCPRCSLHFKLDSPGTVSTDAKRPQILIVQEQGYFRQAAEDALNTHCRVETASSVFEADEVLGRGGVDLMVLDIMLDDGEGKQLLRAGMLKPCPILIYTSRDVSEMYGQAWEELSRLGADDIVFQGMNVEESLWRKVATLLGGHWDDETDTE